MLVRIQTTQDSLLTFLRFLCSIGCKIHGSDYQTPEYYVKEYPSHTTIEVSGHRGEIQRWHPTKEETGTLEEVITWSNKRKI